MQSDILINTVLRMIYLFYTYTFIEVSSTWNTSTFGILMYIVKLGVILIFSAFYNQLSFLKLKWRKIEDFSQPCFSFWLKNPNI